MAVQYRRFDGEEVSRQWYRLLTDLRAAGVQFYVNEGHRTMARQAELVRAQGVWSLANPHGAALPSSTAPHIRTGRADHAIDVVARRGAPGGAPAALIDRAARRGVALTRTVPGESWHLEANAAELHRYAVKRARQIERAKARREAKRAKARARRIKERAQHLARVKVTRVSAAAVEMVARFEGGQSSDGKFRAYWDRTGQVWTIGYGHTRGVKQGMIWTADRAKRELKRELNLVYAPKVAALGLPLTQAQFDALTSAIYNLGPGVLDNGRSLGDALRARKWQAAGDALRLYVNSGGKRLPGLVKRREAERALFLGELPRPA